MDKHAYKGWLNSDIWWKRALSIVGYDLLGSILIWILFLVIVFIMAIINGLYTGMFGY